MRKFIEFIKCNKIITSLIVVSIIFRVINLSNPILEMFGFRQTQTAITVQNYIREGVSFFNYQTPVLGEPWTLPMEFPIYQFFSYLMYNVLKLIGITNLDIAMRVTSIIFFYGSVWLLYSLTKKLINEKTAIITMLVCLFSPFCIYWSRSSMIESCATFFGLGYVIYFYKVYDKLTLKNIIICCLFGILGYLTKTTSMLPICIFIACIILLRLIEDKYFMNYKLLNRDNRLFLVSLFTITIVPLIVGVYWIKYSDKIKYDSNYSGLTSSALKSWNFGTFDQKINFQNWNIIFERIFDIIPATILVLAIILLPFLFKKRKVYLYFLATIISSFGTIFIFFNLYYIHDYYYYAILPFVCLSMGILINQILTIDFKSELQKKIVIYILCGISVMFIFQSNYIDNIIKNHDYWAENTSGVLQLSEYIKANTHDEDWIMVFDDDWSSQIPYYSGRKACMVRHGLIKEPISQYSHKYKLFITSSNTDKIQTNMSDLMSIGPLSYDKTVWGWNVYKKASEERLSYKLNDAITTHYDGIESTNADGTVNLKGWAFSEKVKIKQVYLKTNKQDLIPAIYGVERMDVGDYFDNDNFNYSGFKTSINSELVDSINKLIVVYDDGTGEFATEIAI